VKDGIMLIENPYRSSGNWYRGNTHAHSTNSHGIFSPAELVAWYRGLGYHFLAITDYWAWSDGAPLTTADFLTLSGEEGGEPDVIGIATRGDFGRFASLADGVAATRAQGGLAIVAHPHFSNVSTEELLQLEGATAIELFNQKTLDMNAKGYGLSYWDAMLTAGKRIWGVAVDDSSHELAWEAGKGWIMVQADELSEPAILQSIRDGAFYASNGPVIERVSVQGDEITVVCSPVWAIRFSSPVWSGRTFRAQGAGTLTSATYQLDGKESYVRIECEDACGKIAWSNPLFIRAS
jgi:hypothetical protein